VTTHHVPAEACAAVFHGVSLPLAIERFSIPEPRGSEALIKIRCATICGSDLHSYCGRRNCPTPCILGHEMVGEIAAMGPDGACDYRGNRLAIGDRVTWSVVWSCGECFYCLRGLRSKCERLMKFGHEQVSSERAFLGGLAEYCHLPEKTAIFRVPDKIPNPVASSSNCATATVAAVFRRVGTMAKATVVIHGAGMLGLTACAMAAHRGADHIVVLEPDPRRREQARRFGATEALDTAQTADEIRQRILALTDSRGADVGMELSGTPEAVEQGLPLLRFGGRFVMAGAVFPNRPVQILAEQVVRRMYQIVGVHNYEPEDLETALQFLSLVQEQYPFEELIGRTFPLRDVDAAFQFAEQHRPARVAIAV
jgi:putative phosphonate catabolism associated alcohol dehydrogenase